MQTLSGQLPWSEIKNSTIIIIKLYEKCLPQRPESLPMSDAHWDFIMLCMSLVAEFRPSVVEVLEWVNEVISSREFPCLTLSYITLVSLPSLKLQAITAPVQKKRHQCYTRLVVV